MLLKEVRELDKKMRSQFEGFSLFKVTFKKLKHADEEKIAEVRDWYLHILECDAYKEMKTLWKENSPSYWQNIQRMFSYLPEFKKLTHLRLVFIAYCRRTMPQIIDYAKKDDDSCW